MESFVTQCPQCQTAFRISSAQLKAAGGDVRCGACLHVFNARNNFISEDAAGDFTAQLASTMDIPTVNESGIGDTGMSIEEVSWEEYASVIASERSPQAPETVQPVSMEPEQLSLTADSDDSNAEQSSVRAAALQAEFQTEEPISFSAENRYALHDVASPLELETQHHVSTDRKRILLATTLAVLLIVALGLQLLWFNRDTLSLDPAWRPRVELMCSVLPCTVPPQQDLAALTSSNLVVRSHPEQSGALVVSMNFRNEAGFSQPFPALTLRFTDRQQNLVAARRFLPREYLPEDLRRRNTIPPNATVQARLDIVDPGSEAVNYEVFLGAVD